MIIEQAIVLLSTPVVSLTSSFGNSIQRILHFPRETFNYNGRFFAALRMTNIRVNKQPYNKCSSIATPFNHILVACHPEEPGISDCN
jgi:hypothetical protein